MHDPIYIVSGFPRSGTSMMMRAIETGGIPCVYSTVGDADRNRNTLIPNYVPNPHGFYENAPLMDWDTHRGKCLKVIRDDLDRLPADERLCVVYMTRDTAEIRRSYYGILSGPHPESVYSFLDGYWDKVAADTEGLCGMGALVTVLHYSDVVADPLRAFCRLGWSIDVYKAAATVDPSLYRHRGAA